MRAHRTRVTAGPAGRVTSRRSAHERRGRVVRREAELFAENRRPVGPQGRPPSGFDHGRQLKKLRNGLLTDFVSHGMRAPTD
jgi:hypothetical protein